MAPPIPQERAAIDTIVATYRTRGDAARAAEVARFVAYEQTVELPPALITDPHLLAHIVGRVLAIEPDAQVQDSQRFRIAYNAELASRSLAQLLNLVYGNVSMYPALRLVGLELPDSVLRAFAGPRYGVAGVRRLLGVYGRPLLSTALKPRGVPLDRLAQLAYDFALGGGDVVKDDQNLVDQDFDAFRFRVERCAAAVARANQSTGRNCLYFPHLAARHEELERHAEFVHGLGLRGVLLCPMILGLDGARALAARHDLVFMAHPTLTGVYVHGEEHGIANHLLLGTFWRLAGADVAVFCAPGGRFAYTESECRAIARALTEPLGTLAPALPCPGGGMQFAEIGSIAARYGADSMLLAGGSMQQQAASFVAATRAFLVRLSADCEVRLTEPDRAWRALR
jgi:ribulose-bisphosphate carboxylase large chain